MGKSGRWPGISKNYLLLNPCPKSTCPKKRLRMYRILRGVGQRKWKNSEKLWSGLSIPPMYALPAPWVLLGLEVSTSDGGLPAHPAEAAVGLAYWNLYWPTNWIYNGQSLNSTSNNSIYTVEIEYSRQGEGEVLKGPELVALIWASDGYILTAGQSHADWRTLSSI